MNNKGQTFILRWMTVVAVLLLTFGYLGSFRDTIVESQNNIQCDNTSISVGNQILCLGLDTTLWYFILAIIVGGLGLLWVKK